MYKMTINVYLLIDVYPNVYPLLSFFLYSSIKVDTNLFNNNFPIENVF